jgi:predicted N-acetyltransferase YhbS
MRVETLTAETEPGRRAMDEVMRHSYVADISTVPPEWARVRIVDGVPVAFIIVDPMRCMDYRGGDLPYAFICDVATREDRRMQGHFAAILADTFNALRATGVAVVILHGSCHLYRRFGFDVFTHHSGIFITPEQIEEKLGVVDPGVERDILTYEVGQSSLPDVLVISDIQARTFTE